MYDRKEELEREYKHKLVQIEREQSQCSHREENVPRRSRRCKKCGKVEYTYKQKPIISDYEADFS